MATWYSLTVRLVLVNCSRRAYWVTTPLRMVSALPSSTTFRVLSVCRDRITASARSTPRLGSAVRFSKYCTAIRFSDSSTRPDEAE